MLGHNLDDTLEWVRSWSPEVSGRAAATAALADRIAALTASATGGDGAIRVTVVSSGNVTGLELDDQITQLSGVELSTQIMRTMRRAQSRLAARVAEAVSETVGDESETGRAVLASYARRFPEEADGPAAPVMPSPPPFPTFRNRPSLPHQAPGNGFESGRDSRAR